MEANHPWLCRKFEASLGYMRSYLFFKKKKVKFDQSGSKFPKSDFEIAILFELGEEKNL